MPYYDMYESYVKDLFGGKYNPRLSANAKFYKKELLEMTMTRTLLKLLHSDIMNVMVKSPKTDFKFNEGFYNYNKSLNRETELFTTFDGQVLSTAYLTTAKKCSTQHQVFFCQVANAITRVLEMQYPAAFRYVICLFVSYI